MEDYVPVPSFLRDMIEQLVEISKEASGPIPETPKDWEIVIKIYELWRTFFPDHYKEFLKSASMFREDHLINRGVAKTDQTLLQHKLEIPEYLYHIIKKVYPEFRFDEKLSTKFVQMLPEFNVAGE